VRRAPTVADARATTWAIASLRSVRRQLRAGSVEAVRLDRPPLLPPHAARAVHRVLGVRHATCLERALVLQAWFAMRGHPRAVVIGVSGPQDFAAHAWLDGEAQCHADEYHEIHRLPAR
jgi:Transglutaminase-like superfamily